MLRMLPVCRKSTRISTRFNLLNDICHLFRWDNVPRFGFDIPDITAAISDVLGHWGFERTIAIEYDNRVQLIFLKA